MNLITFGFNEKGTPIFLNQEPYAQVGTMYLMKAGENSVVGITLDDKVFKLTKVPKSGKPKKTKAAKVVAEPKKRSRKPKAEASEAAPKKRGRKAKSAAADSAPKKVRVSRAKKENTTEKAL